jgi:hypothetical protein
VSFPSGAAGLRDSANLLINPECRINQRVFGGGVLAAGAYGYDRWKAGAGGCTLTRTADGKLTLDGVLLQVVEAPELAGQTVTVSLEDPSGDVAVDVAGATGTIGAGSGRRSVTLSLPAGAVGDVIVTLGASAASFARPMLNKGAAPAPFERLPLSVELAMCRRYFAKTFAEAVAPAGHAGYGGSLVTHAIVANAIAAVRWQFPAPMRAVPSVTLYNPAAADAEWSVGGVEAVVSSDIPATAEAVCIGADPAGSPVIAPGTRTAVHAVADAEL